MSLNPSAAFDSGTLHRRYFMVTVSVQAGTGRGVGATEGVSLLIKGQDKMTSKDPLWLSLR